MLSIEQGTENRNPRGMTLREVTAIIGNNKFLVAGVFILALGAGAAYMFLKTPEFQSIGQVLIDTKAGAVLTDETDPGSFGDELIINNSFVERIRGRSVIDSVIIKTQSFIRLPVSAHSKLAYISAPPPVSVERFKIRPSPVSGDNGEYQLLDHDGMLVAIGKLNERIETPQISLVLRELPGEKEDISIELLPMQDAREMMVNALAVYNLRNTNIIHIAYRSGVPVVSRMVINTIINELISRNLEDKRKQASTRRVFLEDQFAKASQQLERVEDNYQQFQTKSGIFNLDEQTQNWMALERYLEERRIEYEIGISQATTAIEKSDRILSGDPDLQQYLKIGSSPLAASNPILTELQGSISELRLEGARLSAEYSPTHPMVKQNAAELQSAQEQMEKVIQELIANATQGVDPLLVPVIEQQLTNHININVYNKLLDKINEEIAALSAKIESLPRYQNSQMRIERERTNNERVYMLLLSQLEEARIQEASTISDIRVLDWAETPAKPVSPSAMTVFPIALLAGVMMSGFAIAGREHFRSSFPSVDNIERSTGSPVVTLLPVFSKKKDYSIYTSFDSNGTRERQRAFELFNTIRMNILFAGRPGQKKVLIVSSALPKEGKSFVSANLAVTMTNAGMKVLLIDCDLRNPTQHKFFKASNNTGIVDFVNNGSNGNGLQKTQVNNLLLLTAGKAANDSVPSNFMNSDRLIKTIEQLENHFDLIIIDTPPVALYTDAVVLASYFGNVLLVMKYNTRRDTILYARKVLGSVNASVLGIVVNDIERSHMKDYGYGYGKNYKYDYAAT